MHELVASLGYDAVSVVGQDWGGSTAFAYAAAYPGEITYAQCADYRGSQ
jgi:pimeloyl-ACP methyl ester carboxylesterase